MAPRKSPTARARTRCSCRASSSAACRSLPSSTCASTRPRRWACGSRCAPPTWLFRNSLPRQSREARGVVAAVPVRSVGDGDTLPEGRAHAARKGARTRPRAARCAGEGGSEGHNRRDALERQQRVTVMRPAMDCPKVFCVSLSGPHVPGDPARSVSGVSALCGNTRCAAYSEIENVRRRGTVSTSASPACEPRYGTLPPDRRAPGRRAGCRAQPKRSLLRQIRVFSPGEVK